MNLNQSTYKACNAYIGLDAEIDRLKAQSLLTWEKEFRNLQWFGLQDGMEVLEVGCGPGFNVQQLVAQLPDSEVTGLDIDRDLLEHAKSLLSGNADSNAKFVQSSIYETSLPDASYDFVIARMVFLHLHEPDTAIKELNRLLKPGGKLVITDIDDEVFGLIEPEIEDFHFILKKFTEFQRKGGGNRLIGRQLPRLLKRAGFSNIELETIAAHSDLEGTERLTETLNPERLRGLYESETLSGHEFNNLNKAINRLSTDPEAMVMMLFLMACGTKTT